MIDNMKINESIGRDDSFTLVYFVSSVRCVSSV